MAEFEYFGYTYEVCSCRLDARDGICSLFHPNQGWKQMRVLDDGHRLFVDRVIPSLTEVRGDKDLVAHRLGGDQKLIRALEATYDSESGFALLRKASRAPFWHRFLVWSALVLSITLVALFIATNFGH